MVLGKLPVPGRPTIWIIVGQGPTVLAVGAGGGCLDIFALVYPFSPLSPSLWETARYRLKYCLKGPLSPKQPTNQPVGAGGGCLDIFSLTYPFSPLSPALWETARYRLKYCLKGSFNPKQPTNQRLGGAKVLGKLSVSGRPTTLNSSRSRAYCACSRCGWVV